MKVRVSGFCSSLGLGPYTKELALLLTTAVCEDGGPEAPDTEENSCGKDHGAQVGESHNKGITETVVVQVHVRS